MYINFSLCRELNLSVSFIPILFAANQNRTNDESLTLSNEEFIDDLKQLFQSGILESVKPKKKSDTVYNLIRLSSKGKKVLEDITTPIATQGDLNMRDYLCEMYLNHEDTERKLGNKKSIGIYCTVLRNHLGLTLHQFYYLCEFFLAEFQFTRILEYVFFNKNKYRYGEFKNHIEDSPLFQFYEEREEEIKNYWKSKIKD